MKTIDLRSDTVTLPTAAMREAIYNAELGDDVFGEDPATNRLVEMAAERLEQEAAILVASGTMGNLISVLSHCGRGDEAILGDQSHTYFYEAGGMRQCGIVAAAGIEALENMTARLAEDHANARRLAEGIAEDSGPSRRS